MRTLFFVAFYFDTRDKKDKTAREMICINLDYTAYFNESNDELNSIAVIDILLYRSTISFLAKSQTNAKLICMRENH